MVVVGLLLRGAKIGVRCRKSGVAPRRGRITSGRVVAVGAPICAEGENVIVTTGADMVLGREGGMACTLSERRLMDLTVASRIAATVSLNPVC